MPSDSPSASTARRSSPRWKKPSSGPLPRTSDGNLRTPPSSRRELKRRLRASAKAAGLALAAAEAARGSHASVRAVDGGFEDFQILGPAGVTGRKLWSCADEVTLLAAAATFRERTGRAPHRADAGALFDAFEGSVSPDIDVGKACDRLDGFESEFLHGKLGASDDGRVRDLCAPVWGAVDVVPRPVPDDALDSEDAGQLDAEEGRLVADEGEQDAEEGRLATERRSKPPPLPRFDAHLPSEGPSTSAMGTDVVTTLPSPSRSMKRLFHPQLSVGDGRPGHTPILRRLGISTNISALTHAAAAAARGSDDSTVHVDGERDDVQRHGTADFPADVGDGTVQRLERADHGAARDSHKSWSDAVEVAFLNAAVAFRERTGRAPRDRDAGVLLQSIIGFVSPHIDEARATYKLQRFRSMFRQEAPGEHATAHDRCLHDLSAIVWGGVVVRDKGAVMPVVREVLGEFWKVNAQAMAGLPLEKGLSLLGKKDAILMETKWRQQLNAEMQTQMERHDLVKEICGLLNDTIMDLDL
jgi:hypothetical protein